MLLVHLLSKKLDHYTQCAYHLARDKTRLPTLTEFLDFLQSRANQKPQAKAHTVTAQGTLKKCNYCSVSGHKLYECRKFKTLAVSERISFVEQHKTCKQYLNVHAGRCKFSFKCKYCRENHNYLLHLDSQVSETTGQTATEAAITGHTSTQTLGYARPKNVLLPTIQMQVHKGDGEAVIVRGLLDSGSQVSLISSTLVNRLRLKTFNSHLNIVGVADNATLSRKSVNLTIESLVHEYQIQVSCSVVNVITNILPQWELEGEGIIPTQIKLADSTFITPGDIDILLGANIFFDSLLNGTVKLSNGLILQNTLFGYVVSGSIAHNELSNLLCNLSVNAKCDMEALISQFWHTEKVPEIYKEYPGEQDACEDLFKNSVEIINNKFQVKLPLKQQLLPSNLGDSFTIALKRFENLEKRFKADPKLCRQYSQFIHEYIELEHAKLHKWCSNNADILKDVPIDKQQFDEVDMNKSDLITKALGLSYCTVEDCFRLIPPENSKTELVTKRQVLSFICKFYDPLGLAGPVLVAAKVFMQRLWSEKLKWDDPLPSNLLAEWKIFVQGLNNMPVIKVPRYLCFNDATVVELVGYCDSSMIAYGAVLYVRSICADKVNVTLLCSKSRTAPINNKLTIPRLELNSALLLSNLYLKVHNLIKARIQKTYLYSDSKVVLAWIKTDPSKLNAYVANRIIKIQKNSQDINWLYINTATNPADCLSRGLSAQEITNKTLWFHGPEELSQRDFSHEICSVELPLRLPEEKEITLSQVVNTVPNQIFNRFSSITKLQEFFHNLRNTTDRILGNLTSDELTKSLKIIIKIEQSNYFQQNLKLVCSKRPVTGALRPLFPFIDGEGILRVGGRLQEAHICYDQKHPMILPKNSYITKLIIIREHQRLLHAGHKQVLSSLNLKFWILSGTREIKEVLHKYVLKAQSSEQLMGNLPKSRITAARPFQNIEGILNSRPITLLSNDPTNLAYLTPGHFLIGAPLTSYPEPDLTSVPENRLKFWKSCIQVQQHFWKAWHRDYLTQLQNRPKWQVPKVNLKEGMLVFLKEDNITPLRWPLGRVSKLFPGRDGNVRVAEIKTENGLIRRSISKIVILPIE
nr:unnamed protein product [Callosobruchus analis]